MSEAKPGRFGAPRVVLLVEIERYCKQLGCSHLNRVGLTKAEARVYNGFECARCERFNADRLIEPDIPEWWKEIESEQKR